MREMFSFQMPVFSLKLLLFTLKWSIFIFCEGCSCWITFEGRAMILNSEGRDQHREIVNGCIGGETRGTFFVQLISAEQKKLVSLNLTSDY
jgi:hypothetical protein